MATDYYLNFKITQKFSSSVMVDTLQVLSSRMCLVAPVLDSPGRDHFFPSSHAVLLDSTAVQGATEWEARSLH